MKQKFKVGEAVRIKKGSPYAGRAGHIAEVFSNHNKVWYTLELHFLKLRAADPFRTYFQNELEPARKKGESK